MGDPQIASPLVYLARVELARVETGRGDLSAMERPLEEALGILSSRRPSHWLTAEAHILLGSCRRRQLRSAEAEEQLREGLQILETGANSAILETRKRLVKVAQAELEEIARTAKAPD